jgi:hypothetical protein
VDWAGKDETPNEAVNLLEVLDRVTDPEGGGEWVPAHGEEDRCLVIRRDRPKFVHPFGRKSFSVFGLRGVKNGRVLVNKKFNDGGPVQAEGGGRGMTKAKPIHQGQGGERIRVTSVNDKGGGLLKEGIGEIHEQAGRQALDLRDEIRKQRATVPSESSLTGRRLSTVKKPFEF